MISLFVCLLSKINLAVMFTKSIQGGNKSESFHVIRVMPRDGNQKKRGGQRREKGREGKTLRHSHKLQELLRAR